MRLDVALDGEACTVCNKVIDPADTDSGRLELTSLSDDDVHTATWCSLGCRNDFMDLLISNPGKWPVITHSAERFLFVGGFVRLNNTEYIVTAIEDGSRCPMRLFSDGGLNDEVARCRETGEHETHCFGIDGMIATFKLVHGTITS